MIVNGVNIGGKNRQALIVLIMARVQPQQMRNFKKKSGKL
jgi:hypothetical protein